jgi:prepilin-type N-terminal cleavage/methylation domain-containing protein
MYCFSSKQGFTLLELLIVCLLISISLAFAIPTLRNTLVTDELASGSRKVISLIKSCRTRATSQHKAFFIFYDVSERKFWYQAAETENERNIAPPSITLPPGIQIRKVTQANTSTSKNAKQNSIWISKQGYMDKTAIELIDKNNQSISLLISAFLPTIKVIEGSFIFP